MASCCIIIVYLSSFRIHEVLGLDVLEDLKRRDWDDSHREVAPLKLADDGIEVDTSGLELEAKPKEAAVIKLTMEAYAENAGNLDRVPIKIYYPSAS